MTKNDLLSVLFPEKCLSCGVFLSDGDTEFFCKKCESEIERVKPPYNHGRLTGVFDYAVAPFFYRGSIKNAILRLKYSEKERVSVFLGKEMSKEINSRFFGVKFDILTCVPATRKSVAERGYNQSRSILEHIYIDNGIDYKCYGYPVYDFNLLFKDKTTEVQHLLGAENRRENIAGAYHISSGRDVYGKTVLLTDDIYTTGSTVNSCAAELKRHGAKAVYVAVAALAGR